MLSLCGHLVPVSGHLRWLQLCLPPMKLIRRTCEPAATWQENPSISLIFSFCQPGARPLFLNSGNEPELVSHDAVECGRLLWVLETSQHKPPWIQTLGLCIGRCAHTTVSSFPGLGIGDLITVSTVVLSLLSLHGQSVIGDRVDHHSGRGSTLCPSEASSQGQAFHL